MESSDGKRSTQKKNRDARNSRKLTEKKNMDARNSKKLTEKKLLDARTKKENGVKKKSNIQDCVQLRQMRLGKEASKTNYDQSC